jgi:hypothetical protein
MNQKGAFGVFLKTNQIVKTAKIGFVSPTPCWTLKVFKSAAVYWGW